MPFSSSQGREPDRRRLMPWVLIASLCLVGSPTSSAQFLPHPSSLGGAHVRVAFDTSKPLVPINAPQAMAKNDRIPDNPQLAIAAPAFSLASLGADAITSVSALDCLAAAIYYEAGNEAVVGQRAVAQIVLNRVRHPAYPKTVCGVVFQGSERTTGCQFTFTCDGSLSRRPSTAKWLRARSVAASALSGSVEPSVGHATHYHASYVYPYWAPSLTKVATIGSHIFYQWQGPWSKPSAFVGRYALSEEMPAVAKVALNGFIFAPLASDEISDQIFRQSMTVVGLSTPVARVEPGHTEAGAKRLSMPLTASTELRVKDTELVERKAELKDDLRTSLLE